MIRPDHVSFLAAAWRHKGRSTMADLVIANRFRDYTREERQAAHELVIAEVDAELVKLRTEKLVLEERLRLRLPLADPLTAQLEILATRSEVELRELVESGLLDDMLRDLAADGADPDTLRRLGFEP